MSNLANRLTPPHETVAGGVLPPGSIASSRFRRKERLEFVGDPFPILGVGRRFPFDRDIRPAPGILGVELQPFFQARFGVWLDRLSGALGLTHAAIDAFVRVNNEHVFTLVEAVHGTHLNAVHVLALNATFDDDVSHSPLRPTLQQALPNATRIKPQRADLPQPDLADGPARKEGHGPGISGQIAVKRTRDRRSTASFTESLHPNHPYCAVEREGHHIANPYGMAGGGHAFAVKPDKPGGGQGGGGAA